MLAVIFGIQGVGKSSVIDNVISSLGEYDFQLLRWGTLTYDICLEKEIIKVGDFSDKKILKEYTNDGVAIVEENGAEVIYVKEEKNLQIARDKMRYLSVDMQNKIQDAVINHIKELSQGDGNFIVETHAALKTEQGYMPGLTQNFLNNIKPDIYVIIEAPAQEIYNRRMSDPTRVRDHDKSVEEVQMNLDTTRYFTSAFSVMSSSPMFIATNRQGKVEECVNEISNVLRKFFE